MRRIAGVIALALVAGACSSGGSTGTEGASGDDFPLTITASNGAVTLQERPERIVSLSPTATEILFAIGAGAQVVAVDDQSNYPAEVPKTDLSALEPNVEAIVDHRPDLVVFANDLNDLDKGLKAVDVPGLLQPAAETLDDTYAQIEQLGKATGHASEAADLVARMRGDIAEIVDTLPEPEGTLTYYHELDQTYYSVTSQTFIGTVYGLLGLENIADAAGEDGNQYPQLSAEAIVDADPDLIFLADTKCCGQNASTVAERPGWSKITAVRTGAVVELDDDVASRWGPRIVDYLREVSAAVVELREAA